jgi:hypothetical protein
MPEEELGRLDPVFVQLVAHLGLPGSDKLDPRACVRRVRQIAERVGGCTERQMYWFRREPADFEHSEAYFRALCLATVLQREFGVRYDPAKIPRDAPFGVEDTTAQGALFGSGGTCASLPVLYASVGRHLGYPLKLVSCYVTKEVTHLFVRWEGPGDRFNVETTGTGLCVRTDGEYRTGKYGGMTAECERLGRFLVSKTPRMELAGFLHSRAGFRRRGGDRRLAAEAFAWAFALDPLNVLEEDHLRLSLNDWTDWAQARTPPGFPAVTLERPRGHRFFPDSLPAHYEDQMLGLSAVEDLLLDAEYAGVWERMRRGEWRGRGPNRATVRYRPDGTSETTLTLSA